MRKHSYRSEYFILRKLLSEVDQFQLWRYQKIRVRLLSISGLLRRLRSTMLPKIKAALS